MKTILMFTPCTGIVGCVISFSVAMFHVLVGMLFLVQFDYTTQFSIMVRTGEKAPLTS